MHSSLARHLHTEECNKLIDQYMKCAAENKFAQYMGVCTQVKQHMEKCIQNELVEKRKQAGIDLKKRELQFYVDHNPQLAEKVKLLEKLKGEKEKEETVKLND